MEILNVATVAFEPAWEDKEKNLVDAEAHVKKILKIASKTQIILFPETSLTGYVLDGSNARLAEPMTGRVVSEMCRIAKDNKVAIVSGMIEKGKEDRPYNTTFVAGKNGGLLARYRKNHLFTESPEPEVYSPGQDLAIFELDGWRCGLSTCFDIRFPRLFEAYKKSGVECVFSGFNWVAGRNKAQIMDFLVKARAHENQYFMVAVDRSGSDPNYSYHGVSVISDPYGEDVSQKEGAYSWAALNKGEIETLSKNLPLEGSFKERYSVE